MKYYLTCLILLIAYGSECQISYTDDDKIKAVFLSAIHSDIFSEEFRICDLECDVVNIFDLNNQIVDFPPPDEICSKKVRMYNTTSIDHPTPSSIIIYKISLEGGEYIDIYFLRPYSGASVIFTYNVEEGKVLLTKTRIGTF